MKQLIDIATLDRTELQTRAALNAEAVRDYAEILKETPDVLPPVEVYVENDVYRLSDGFHRVAAALKAGLTQVVAEVNDGDYPTALRAALKANVTHGMRRTNADKRQAMRKAWEHRRELFGGNPTERDFAAVCCVSNGTAHNFLADMSLLKMSKLAPNIASNNGTSRTDESTANEAIEEAPADNAPEDASADAQKKDAPTDRFGMEIPARLIPAFANKTPQVILRDLRRIRRVVEQQQQAGEIAMLSVGQQALITLDNAIICFKLDAPYCVCRACRGMGCACCKNSGFQTKLQYSLLPHEFKPDYKGSL